MKNVLITGGTGFIGSTLKFGKNYTGRLTDIDTLAVETTNCKGIVHLAAISNKRLCEAYPDKCISTNLLGLCNVLELALQRRMWVLFVSTFQVKDRNLYGLTKLLGEELCRLYQSKGLKVKILRLPIVYGPHDKTDKVVTKITNEVQQGIETKIVTNDKFYFLYVSDAAKLIENEVRVICGKSKKKYTLTDLVTGLKRTLNAA